MLNLQKTMVTPQVDQGSTNHQCMGPKTIRFQPEQCPACLSKFSLDQIMRIDNPAGEDSMIQGDLATSLRGLVYGRCRACRSLIAMDERRQQRVLDQIYRDLPDTYWQELSQQDRFANIVEDFVSVRAEGPELWDVGCGTGNLLARLHPSWKKHGLEPGRRAVKEAQRQGMDVREGTAATAQLRDVADVVLAVDVVEHLLWPIEELTAIHRMLKPGGIIAIFTGIADALIPRMAGKSWYYLHCVGHVTVFSSEALKTMLSRIGMVDIESHRIEHQGAISLRQWCQRVAGNGIRMALGRPAACLHFYHDHQLLLARKPVEFN
ncbi:MAG: methyltransferase protein [Acidobacteria bacterium]|nr:methyltransferase protein [Acidobacteriota bacterium]